MGDFNIDIERDGDKADRLVEWMDSCSLGPVVPDTNTSLRSDRIIDYAITTGVDLTIQTYEGDTSSDHKPLLGVLISEGGKMGERSRTIWSVFSLFLSYTYAFWEKEWNSELYDATYERFISFLSSLNTRCQHFFTSKHARPSIPQEIIKILAQSRSLSFKAKRKGDIILRTEARRLRNLARFELKRFQQEQLAKSTPPSLPKPSERRKRPNRRRPLPPDQIELSRQNIPSHQPVTINPLALELLKNFNHEKLPMPSSSSSSIIDTTLICESDSDKATQTYTRVSVGTECCSLTNTELNLMRTIPIKTTEQKSSQTQSRIRVYKKRRRSSTKKTTMTSTTIDDGPSSVTIYTMPTNTFNASTMTQWENVPVNDMETQILTPTRSDMCIQTVGNVSNLLDYPSELSENNNSVIVQTLPISMTSTQMQTITEYPIEQTTNEYNNYLLPYQESVGTSCFLDEFLLDDLSKNDPSSSVLFDFDAMDLLDLIDNGTQTYPLISSHETQTMTNWDSMLLNEDEWIRTMMNN
ncbi:unnamed protein product [Rotaria sp. Silwood2]|nr:unnamed protein product [Rotaria sp. Silwood2]